MRCVSPTAWSVDETSGAQRQCFTGYCATKKTPRRTPRLSRRSPPHQQQQTSCLMRTALLPDAHTGNNTDAAATDFADPRRRGPSTQAAAAALLRQLRRVDTRQVDTSAVQKASALAGRSSDRLCPAILTESPRLDLAATLLTEAQGCLLRHVWLGGWCRWWWDLHMMYACMCLVSGRDVTYAYM